MEIVFTRVRQHAGRHRIERLEDAGSLREIPNEGKVRLVVHELRLFGAGHVAVRVEHLLEEGCAGAWMAAKQRDAPGWLEHCGVIGTTVQNTAGVDTCPV